MFGVQVERRLDFVGPQSLSGGLLGLLLGTADKGRNAVGAGKPKGRTEPLTAFHATVRTAREQSGFKSGLR